jgi:hypothetical protein
MKSADYLKFYSTKFQTIEVDSTFYGTPSASTVEKWYERTPPDFIFAAKIPQVITHDKVLVDCDSEFDEFVKTMDILGPRSDGVSIPVVRPLEIPEARSFPRRTITLPEETSCRPQICNRDSKQHLARCQIRGPAPAAQRRAGPDRHIVYAKTVGDERKV